MCIRDSNGSNNIVYNAITESISFPAGYSQVQYSVNGGAWTPYTEPFAIDGNDPRYPFTPGGSAHGATLQVSFNDGSVFWTNTYTPALFEVAPLVGNPPMNPAISGSGGANLFTNIQGPLSVTMSTATAGATSSVDVTSATIMISTDNGRHGARGFDALRSPPSATTLGSSQSPRPTTLGEGGSGGNSRRTVH